MKLVVPHTGTLQGPDARLIRLAEFLGIACEPLFLDTHVHRPAEYIAKAFPDHGSCFVLNPQVIRDWTGGVVPVDLVSCLTSHFPYLLVHALMRGDSFYQNLIKALSGDRLHSVRPVRGAGQLYEIASDCEQICGPFSGLSFGPVNPANDRILSSSTDTGAARTPISIGGSPFMAAVKRENTEILFLASADILDVSDEIEDTPLSEYFSRFVPHAMALRYIFGEQCWRPCGHYASFIIDDPLLRPNYGFLNFESLLHLMEKYNFCTTFAFIPHNYRRNSKRILRIFRENGERLAICFHGNDHTASELALADTSRINTMIGMAEARMNTHRQVSGLPCEKVMVFPQGNFSVEAMEVLKSRNFCAAVNTAPHPAHIPAALSLRELAQPAVLRYGGFPLFLRKPIRETKRQDIAFNLFFGKPVLIVEHHDVFRRPETLAEAALMVNSVAPDIRWSNLETAVINSSLRRRTPEGACHVRAYSRIVQVANNQDSPQQVSVEWNRSGQYPPVEQVLQDGSPYHPYEVDDSGIRLSVRLGARNSRAFSVVYRNDYPSLEGLGFRWGVKAFIRRRLSEVRDNYISKNQHALKLAKVLQRGILTRSDIKAGPRRILPRGS
jgi:hypothetical protein